MLRVPGCGLQALTRNLQLITRNTLFVRSVLVCPTKLGYVKPISKLVLLF